MAAVIETQCCIAGGGPAGMMLGFLLARAGVEVVVLEKHADFLRDFRGDTIHPSTSAVMDDLGLLQDFLQLPHQRVERLTANVYGEAVTIADFTHLKARCPYLVHDAAVGLPRFPRAQRAVHPGFHAAHGHARHRRDRARRRGRRRPRGISDGELLRVPVRPRRGGRRTPHHPARERRPGRPRSSARRSTCSGSA